MPDSISLRAYLTHVEDLLAANSTDEVIHHCRQILQYFPKNAEAFRLLGRALLENSRWDEAGAVFRRVLSVYPDDFAAHVGLSEVYVQRNRPNDGIWHLERAFEQDPNNAEIIKSLRELYRRYQNVDQPKIQLTTAAVARQYARNGLYEQAVNTLRATLERISNRVDLRLLLAQTLWASSYHVEAAETALDVLRELPDALEANRILAELWLAEDRPSDAQRYVNRIEAVDPYLALEVATGQPAPDHTYSLEQLDYRRFAQSQIATAQPDWLQEISSFTPPPAASESSTSVPTWLGGTGSQPSPQPLPQTDELPDEADLFGDAAAAEWLTDVKSAAEPSRVVTSQLHPEKVDDSWRSHIDDEEDRPGESIIDEMAREMKRETSTFANIFTTKQTTGNLPKEAVPDWVAQTPAAPEPPAVEDPLAWLTTSDEASATVPAADGEDDPLAWLRGEDVEIDEDAERPQFLFDAEEPDFEHQDADPLAWMQQSGIELEDGAPSTASQEMPEQTDALAWLRGEDVEIDEDAERPQFLFDAENSNFEHDNDDPLAWMQDAGIEIEDAQPDLPDLDTFAAAAPVTAEADEEDPLAWMQDAGVELSSEAQASEGAATEEETGLDWMSEDLMAALELDDAAPSTGGMVEEEDMFEWLQDESLAGDTSAASEDAPPAHSVTLFSEESTELGIPFDSDPNKPTQQLAQPEETGEPEVAELDILDAGFGDVMSSASAMETLEPVNNLTDRQEDMSDKDDQMPDWLSGQPAQPKPEGASSSASDEFSFDEEASDADVEIPDWLAALGPEYVHPETLSQPPQQETTPGEETQTDFDWMTGFAEMEPEGEEAAAPADVPDWMSELQPEASTPAEPESADEFAWMSSLEDSEEADEAAAPADVPDWMSELQPEASTPAEPESADEFAWMSSLEDSEEADEAAAPDWMSQMQPPAESPTPAEPETADEFAWMSSLEDSEEAEEAAPADVPDWMSELQPETPTPAEPEATSEFEWMSELEDEGAEEAAAPANVPDWMSDLQPAATPTPETETSDSEFEWMSELEDEGAEEAAAPTAAPDWMSQMQPPAESPASAEPEAVSEFDWMSSFDEAEDEEAQPASEAAPDWLSDIRPAEMAPEPEAAGTESFGSEFEWLSELEEAEAAPAAEAAAPPAASEEIEWESDLGGEAAAAQAEDVPDWLNEIKAAEAVGSEQTIQQVRPSDWEVEAEEALESTTSEAPDWLSEMKPEGAEEGAAPTPAESFDWEAELDEAEAVEPSNEEWLVEIEPQEEQAAARVETVQPGEQPEWLTDFAPEQFEDEEPVAEQPERDEFGWLIDSDTPEGETDGAETSQFGDEAMEPEGEGIPATLHAPADNAPDWLNAMVPGVDVDYEAEEDAQIETEFAEGSSHRTRTETAAEAVPQRDFQWLVDIVDEETGAMPAVENAPAAATQTAAAVRIPEAPTQMPEVKPQRQSRFSFSRPPAWLRGKSSQASSTPPPMADWPSETGSSDDDDSGDDDFDLPEWLR